jgi:hypothetical protein
MIIAGAKGGFGRDKIRTVNAFGSSISKCRKTFRVISGDFVTIEQDRNCTHFTDFGERYERSS